MIGSQKNIIGRLSSPRALLIALVAAAFILRLAFFLDIKNNQPALLHYVQGEDMFDYFSWAKDISQGHLRDSTANSSAGTPLYGLLSGGLFVLFGAHPEVVSLFQFAVGAFAMVLLFRILLAYVSSAAIWVILLGYLFYAPLAFYEILMLRDQLMAVCTLLVWWGWIRFEARPTISRIAALGFFCALTFINRQNTIFFLPFFFILLYFRRATRQVDEAVFPLQATMLFLSFVGLLLPFVFLQWWSQSGHSSVIEGSLKLFIWANLHTVTQLGFTIPAGAEQALVQIGNRPSQALWWWINEWMSYPLAMLQLYGRKISAFFATREIPNNENFYLTRLYSPTLRWMIFSWGWFSSLGLVGLFFGNGDRKKLYWLRLFTVLNILSVIVFLGMGRTRLQVFFLLAILAAVAVDYFLKLLQEKNWQRLGVLSFVTVSLLLLSLRITEPLVRSQDYFNFGMKNLLIEHDDEAMGFFTQAQAVEKLPQYSYFLELTKRRIILSEFEKKMLTLQDRRERAVVNLNIGQLRFSLGDLPGALQALQEGLLVVRDADAFFTLALIANVEGKKTAAFDYVEQALAVNPQHVRALQAKRSGLLPNVSNIVRRRTEMPLQELSR